jgi:hypothetical protein
VAESEAAAEERRRAEAAERAVLLGSAFLSEVSGSSAGAVAAPGDGTYATASPESGAGVVEAKPGGAEPAWRHPGVRAWQLLAAVSLLVIGALLAAYFLTRPQHSTATPAVTGPTASTAPVPLAQVPDVVTEEQESALAKLRAAGFKPRVKTVPAPGTAGVVIQESPSAGTKARKGSAIMLRVSASVTKTTPLPKGVLVVPSVVGLGKTVALNNLTATGLAARISYVASSAAPGRVIAQSPGGGVTVKRGTKVILAISRGS